MHHLADYVAVKSNAIANPNPKSRFFNTIQGYYQRA